jgi:CheY-like chemotaxis protein
MMPHMDGPTTFARLREEEACRDIPVIFMTAKVQPAEVEQYRKLGAIGVISKPFDPMTLPDEIRNLWKQSHESKP